MPVRLLRDGILTSERIASLNWAEEVFYRRLMSVADDHGRYFGNPTLIRSACYPLQIDRVSDADIQGWLSSCVDASLVHLYSAEDGKRYLQILDFGQQVRSKSKFPEPLCQHVKTDDNNCYRMQESAHLDGDVVEDDKNHTSKSSISPCPVEKIIELYKSIAVNLPGVRVVADSTKAAISARWRSDEKFRTLEFWEKYFRYCEDNEFLSGRSDGKPGQKPFRADLDWLVKASNFAKVLNEKYR